jgi:O-antigen/teichoic acid export membrane protein
MLENLVKVLLGLVVSVYVIKYLGPKDFGILSYALSIVGILSPFASLGIDAILFRNLINDKENKNKANILHTAKVLKLFASLISVILSSIFIYFYSDDIQFIYIFILLLFGLIIDVFALYKEYFLSIEKPKIITISSVVAIIISSALSILFVILKLHIIWFALVHIVRKLINIISLKYFYKKQSTKDKGLRFDIVLAKDMLKDSWPLIFTSFAGLLYMSTDQILIKYFLDFEEVGLYATAIKLIMVFYVTPSILSNILYPKIMQSYNLLNTKEFLCKTQKIYVLNFSIAIIILIFFILFGEYLILILFGDEFMSSVDVLYIYSFGIIFVFFGSMNNKLLMMQNLQKLILTRSIFGLIINLMLNILLIPRYGIEGAAIATVFSEFLIVLSYGLNHKTRYILWLQLKSFIYPLVLIKEKFL